MQEVSGSIPLGSTNLLSLKAQRARYREAAKVARRSPKGEDGLFRLAANLLSLKAQRARYREAAKTARHSPKGEDGLFRLAANLLSLKAQRARYREAAKVARRSPKGEDDGPVRAMKYVYLLESIDHPEQNHVGMTDDLKSRFETHNAGGSPHTAKYKPCVSSPISPSRIRRKLWRSSAI
jgi:hypothetical protein